MIKICPNCKQKYSVQSYDLDYIHECNSSSEAINNEDVTIIGNYIDEKTNNEITVPKLQVTLQGNANKLQGTRAGIEGKNVDELTSRGNRKSTHRSRQYFEYINLKEGDK